MGPASILWAATARTPMSVDVTDKHVALVLGDAFFAGDRGRAGARDVATSWLDIEEQPDAYDGFHAAAVIAADGHVRVGGDVLGHFPVYYAALGDVLLVGATPEPFRWHPVFRSAVSLEGLLTVLLFGGPYLGRCVLEGVVRLESGRVLTWQPGASPREALQYDIPTEHRHASLTHDEQIELVHDAYRRVVRRLHPTGEPQGILLSGGRDSRLIAGYLHAQGSRVEALTIGQRTDHEVICASAVARELGFTHHVVDDSFEHDVDHATRCARWEHLAGGLATMHTWETIEASRALPFRCGNGYLRAREQPLFPTDTVLLARALTRRSIGPDTLRMLVRGAEALDLVDGLVARFDARYQAVNDLPEERAGRLLMDTYARFYVGSLSWRLSFGSWPVNVELDREFLSDWIGIPIRVLASRGMVEPILARHFPRLARLPLDRNAATTHPIAPSLAYRARQWLGYRLPWMEREAHTVGERRIYYRQYDLDNPGWRDVRRAAEPHREALARWFDPAVVDRLLPAPDAASGSTDPMNDRFPAKALLGLMLWLRDHPEA
jgi:asparagine synthase (glutamine-hydrolysing)